MGSSASKSAAQSTIRKFPNRAPGSAVPPPTTSPSSQSSAAARAASERIAAQRAAAGRAPQDSSRGEKSESPAASLFKDEAIREDGYDPHMPSPDNMIQPELAKRLREIGVVQPNPTYSRTSTATISSSQPQLQQTETSGPIFPAPSQNRVLSALEARRRLQLEAEAELESLGLSNSQGRKFLHAGMIRDILVMRERGASQDAIETRFNLKRGVVKRLGPPHLYKPAVGGEPLPV